MIIELDLNGEFGHDVNGKNNSDRVICDGIRLVCEPNPDFQNEITESLKEKLFVIILTTILELKYHQIDLQKITPQSNL